MYLFSQRSSGFVHEAECEPDLVGRQQCSNALRQLGREPQRQRLLPGKPTDIHCP